MAYYEQDVENLCTANVENQVVNSGMWRMWKTYPQVCGKLGGQRLLVEDVENLSTFGVDISSSHEICAGEHEMSLLPSYPHRMWITWWKNVQKWQGCT